MDTYHSRDLTRYREAAATPAVGDRGQMADPLLLSSRPNVDPQVIEITPHVRTIVGLGLSATHVITGNDGLIVVDTGAGVDEASAKLTHIRTFSAAPIRAVIYTHYHYASGTAALIPHGERVQIYAHPNLDRNHAEAISELATIKHRRVSAQAGHTLPSEGPDADSAGTTVANRGSHGYLPPTQTIAHNGQELLIHGVRFVFYTDYPFDTDCTLLIWLPDLETVIHNHMSGNFPNVYSIGGGPFRDPRPWLAGLDKIRELAPEHLLGCHGMPFSGRAKVTEVVTVTRDALQFVFDQTVRAMNRGLSPAEAIDFVQLPESLAHHSALTQTYGEVWHHVMSIYHGLIGWYDGDAVNLLPVSPGLESSRIVEGFGGAERASEAARAADSSGRTAPRGTPDHRLGDPQRTAHTGTGARGPPREGGPRVTSHPGYACAQPGSHYHEVPAGSLRTRAGR
jgi:alkyl sulfatase BDS1-like metallo-beta-lactamase superfamily hydrolase